MRLRDKYRPYGLSWLTAGWFTIVFCGAVLAVCFPSWPGVHALWILWLTTGLGVTAGFHRLLTHNSFQTYRPVKWIFALAGSLAGQGPPLYWVTRHREHHRYSDAPGDPHSPRDFQNRWLGFLWSHMLWMLQRVLPEERRRLYEQYARDLYTDRVLRILDSNAVFIGCHLLFGACLYTFGLWLWDAYIALSLLLWGLFFRMVVVFHWTWAVNSLGHMFGYRNYQTRDDSRNNLLIALPSLGEGWHNNHHHAQQAANHGQRWFEIDPTYYFIRLLVWLRLAWNVRVWNYRRQEWT
ncbi:MAG: hypothetical protein COT71_02010 [Candidatus Andersenbacteria bacterium CG10_big_fil_rev_8_21_14_0_10_54_11]|uniref:Fatty acid desaturase domain-containing protein n=1 Tax=Candidatus Andersenbacteria bacterium CG10_big_fil_rev_8_21_14_0_10_54_11 TaxID=1974485 RepID=A0A2M6WZL1_9BACT|nr:MAG: hypothetical protein COT71_02010 [Candidatus Andersenbacteria bacterium CG10_big_fil_rev_8_21_14_0_10_54_11]